MLLLHTDSLGTYGLHRVFAFAKMAGYEGIEVGISPQNLDSQNPEYLRQLSEDSGVKIFAVQAEQAIDKHKMEIAYKTAQEVAADLITVSPPAYFNYGTISWLKENTPKLRAQGHIKIALLNTPDDRMFGVVPKYAMTTMQDLREFHQMTLDVSNLVSRQLAPLDFYEKMKSTIFHVHLSNYRGDHSHCLPNEGRLPLESLLKKMKRDGYAGKFSLRVRPSELHAGRSDDEIIMRLRKAKEFFDEYFS